ncbi:MULTISPECIES: hypothetical protein [unclassified Shinella]|jgi:hypothetical protein|uniref:hypothetical protein n=1 Tax=unclassified Shinella TaxID=2643062 RepID=UPI00234E8FEF|nr:MULTISPECIES: hypothetical protein [unclassified Shinella]MCO5148362.1 hypothetical protein [Shinella sp.]MDC7264439.1 hypothetical protein [Shinella sp. HY16]MDC7271335.1 hypothetical protein [Shinella sp. YZ44]MDG4676336.1 hypothetical protein [Shinella sp. 838]
MTDDMMNLRSLDRKSAEADFAARDHRLRDRGLEIRAGTIAPRSSNLRTGGYVRGCSARQVAEKRPNGGHPKGPISKAFRPDPSMIR